MKYVLRGSNNPNLVERIFENRRVDIEQRKTFLNPSATSIQNPRVYDNMEKAVNLYLSHVKNGSHILVVVDTDCDGYCSNSAFINYTREVMGHDNITYLMHEDKRHGLTEEIMNQILEIRPDLVVLIDAGSNDYKQHEKLFMSEIPLIILDHHECEGYSQYALVVNNQLSANGNKTLSGGGMVMKFMELADELTGKCGAEDYMDLVAVSLVADSMLMTEEETRYYVLEGLDNIENPMLLALTQTMTNRNFSSVSYDIAPSLNSIIRVGEMEDKIGLFDALICNDRTETIKLRGQGEVELPLAEYVVKMATRLKGKQTRLIKKVLEDENTTIITENLPITFMIYEDEDAMSLTGLIASRLVERYNKPAIVMKQKDGLYYHGSARSTSTLNNFRDVLIATNKFDFCQGHQGAFGCKIKNKEFSDLLTSLLHTTLNTGDECYVVDKAYTDGRVSAMDIISVDELKDYWCRGFEKPLFYIRLNNVNPSEVTTMGASNNTVKINKDYISYIKFKCTEEDLTEFLQGGTYDIEIIGTFNVNEWNGRSFPQVFIEDYKITKRTEEFEIDWDSFNAFGAVA